MNARFRILVQINKGTFMAGFPNARFSLRGQKYEYDFKNMVQINKGTGKSRAIRAPNKWKAPKEPLVPPGKTTVVNVPRGAPGTTIQSRILAGQELSLPSTCPNL